MPASSHRPSISRPSPYHTLWSKSIVCSSRRAQPWRVCRTSGTLLAGRARHVCTRDHEVVIQVRLDTLTRRLYAVQYSNDRQRQGSTSPDRRRHAAWDPDKPREKSRRVSSPQAGIGTLADNPALLGTRPRSDTYPESWRKSECYSPFCPHKASPCFSALLPHT